MIQVDNNIVPDKKNIKQTKLKKNSKKIQIDIFFLKKGNILKVTSLLLNLGCNLPNLF